MPTHNLVGPEEYLRDPERHRAADEARNDAAHEAEAARVANIDHEAIARDEREAEGRRSEAKRHDDQHMQRQVDAMKQRPDWIPSVEEAQREVAETREALKVATDTQRPECERAYLKAIERLGKAEAIAAVDAEKRSAEEAKRETPDYQAQNGKLAELTPQLAPDVAPEIAELTKLARKVRDVQHRLDEKVRAQHGVVTQVRSLRGAMGLEHDPAARPAMRHDALFILTSALHEGN